MPLGPCRFTNAAGGLVDWTYPGPTIDLQSPTSAGAANGAVYEYYAQSLDMSQWEIGTGAYNSGTGVFARTTILANSLGTTAKISFTNPPEIAFYDLFASIASPAIATPLMDGTAQVGTSVKYAREDHRHPVDTSRAAATDVATLINHPLQSANIQMCRVALAANQAIGTLSTRIKILFDTVSFDPASIWDATNHRIKPTIAGYYQVNFSVGFSATSLYSGLGVMQKTGVNTDIFDTVFDNLSQNGGASIWNGSDIVHFDGSTEYLEAFAFFNTGTSPQVNGALQETFLSLVLVKAD